MNLKELREKGGIIDASLVKKSVSWKHPDEGGKEVEDVFDVHIRRLAYGMVESILRPDSSGKNRSVTSLLISSAVMFGEDADEQLSYDEAYQLEPGLAAALSIAVKEVNQLGPSAKN